MFDRTPPHDKLAEQAVLGACLTRSKIPAEAEMLHGHDFYLPAHETIWVTIQTLTANAKPCDSIAVNAYLVEHQQAAPAGGFMYLSELKEAVPVVANVGYYVEIVLDRATRRHGINAHTSGLQDFYESDDDALTILERSESRLAKVPTRRADDDALMNLDEFVDQELPPEEWVIPHLLAKGDRIVITGSEGLGKSTLVRQIAACAAAGINPFTGRGCPPQNVLAVDAENPERIMVDRYKSLRAAIRSHGHIINPNRLWIVRRPQGLNLLDPADKRWLVEKMVATNPDLLVIGPTYKLYFGGAGDSDESVARKLTGVLDELRERFNCALVLEHHMPHAGQGARERTVRPIGSSLWLRWPEFGYGIRSIEQKGVTEAEAEKRRLVEFIPWRGPRDLRDWPRYLESGGAGLPWVETEDVESNRFGRAS